MAVVTDKAMKFITSFEGFDPNPFWDVSRYSHGYGTAATQHSPPISKADARRELEREIEKVILPAIPRLARLKQQEIDALASFGYNLGPAALMDPSYSTFARRMQSPEGKTFEGRSEIYKDELPKWRMPGSQYEQGLLRRRHEEIEMAIKGDYRM